jgi:anti-sigma factor RsiW
MTGTTRKTWSAEEISAYIDGELGPEARAAFEAAMAQDADLRQEVAAMRSVVDLVQAVPLRPSPRNYLLTPSMVEVPAPAAPEPARPRRRRVPLFAMRLATSVVAVAFVVTLALNVVSSRMPVGTSMAPPRALEQADVPATSVVVETVVVEKQVEVPVTPETEAAPGETLMEEPVEAPEAPEEAPPPPGPEDREEMELAPLEEAPTDGRGGGADEPPPAGTPLPQATVPSSEPAGGEAEGLSVATTPTGTATFAEPAPQDDEVGVGMMEAAPEARPPFPPRWLTWVLGVTTLILAGVTYWMSRRS